ncbi:DgyrCDS602 [Dimorphilus gyrociliatus]|uniref:Midasin n=1 Tax=Dimorphilus gyrociliatus TaxID=2664684 RepID=A0A7I8V9M9_9ANNE|nr:DgyrCDS602 [Dimorphilus gyrociliatus]
MTEDIQKLETSLDLLCSKNVCLKDILKSNLETKKKTKRDYNKILQALSESVLKIDCYYDLVLNCSNLIPELLSRNFDITVSHAEFQTKCVVLSKIVELRPDLSKLATSYILKNKPFYSSTTDEPEKKRKKMNRPSLEERLKALLIFVRAEPILFRNEWDWSQFIKFFGDSNRNIRCLACEILCDVFQISSEVRFSLWSTYLEPQPLIECISRSKKGSQIIKGSSLDPTLFRELFMLPTVDDVFLTSKLSENNSKVENPFILTPSIRKVCHLIALSIAEGKASLIKGSNGSGKTSLIKYIASLTNRSTAPHFLTIQLSEQTDSKSLLGTYRCTPIPGQFEWVDGTLTTAVLKGHWLLLEDIDKASDDVVSLLAPLLNNSCLTIPGHRNNVRTHSEFRLFATRKSFGSFLLQNQKWNTFDMPDLDRIEMSLMLNEKYPNLSSITEKILDIFEVSNTLRPSSLRDITKFCNRINRYIKDDLLNAKTLSEVLQEAAEVFVLSSPSKSKRLSTLTHIGSLLNVNPAQCEHLMSAYRAEIKWMDENFTAGRITLKKFGDDSLYEWTNTRQAANLVENLAACVLNNEATLLVGETGTGKTSAVQYLASNLGKCLTVINMNQYTDCTDLLGGYKPVGGKVLVNPIREKFQVLFRKSFDEKENTQFIGKINDCLRKGRWKLLLKVMKRICDIAIKKPNQTDDWLALKQEIDQVHNQISQISFSFVEGSLVEAVKKGHWILLDELNLAPPDTLDGLISLLTPDGSLTLLEKGDKVPVKRHPEFRLFACMNPATDVGKRHLPVGVRNRFTELYVEELVERNELLELVDFYLKDLSVNKKLINTVVDLYKTLRKKSETDLEDGTGRKPHYSLRTLCRALRYARSQKSVNFSYCLYEAFCLSFLTCLNRHSEDYVESEIRKAFGGKGKFLQLGKDYVTVKGYWIKKGEDEQFEMKDYVMTKTVDLNLKNLARAASASLPILVQGETSVGKTSLIKYLARLTGNTVLRINNHEHTDMQEYIGCYTTDGDGVLTYQDGVLVQAMRKGYWIILDELNLAPTDVLEALNRVLDDNRELLITETREVVKADPKFMLFATQNPAGTSYGGRKELSRAFRNRFIELHFDLLPEKELVQIVHKRCKIPQSYAEKLVKVMKNLQLVRRKSGVFVGKEGFITLRDLFRWANRYRLTEGQNKDWNQFLAEQGFMLLAGRVRCEDEAVVVKEIIEKAFPRTNICESDLFSVNSKTCTRQSNNIMHQLMNSNFTEDFKHLVWTKSLRRMAVLLNEAITFSEPVLLVGQTGCGKTTLSYLFANQLRAQLWSISCHRNTEVGDILGSLRPVRNRSENDKRLFEWVDGPLVDSMKAGGLFLLDEVSLVDDSVIERLNSVLELDRSLVLAEKGGEEVFANDKFRLVATMNPGGDFGKKELSPALRNRFTEIWCLSETSKSDLVGIIKHNSKRKDVKAESMVDFVEWLKNNDDLRLKDSISIRDYLNWIEFINRVDYLDMDSASFHGGCMSFIDAFGTGAGVDDARFSSAKQESIAMLRKYFPNTVNEAEFQFSVENSHIKIGPFVVEKGQEMSIVDKTFNFSAPTTKANVLKIVRALALDRPILLEGSPGVGKTTVVQELARVSGFQVTRINLSEQTDISDLFGADLPVEGGKGGLFEWRDGPILKALKNGHWIILDELNLASQSVLEGLNAILDHRGEVFIPELNRTFHVSKRKTRLFGCQNPYVQGAGRKGLPQSFLNRFVKVYAQVLTREDLVSILNNAYPEVIEWSEQMIDFNCRISEIFKNFWEFNLRDVFRWCELIKTAEEAFKHPSCFVRTIYLSRMRNEHDVSRVLGVYCQYFPEPKTPNRNLFIDDKVLRIGDCEIERQNKLTEKAENLILSHKILSVGEDFLQAIRNGWMIMLVGSSGCGKTSIVKTMAALAGRNLSILNINANMDTIELLGGFEQADVWRLVHEIQDDLEAKISELTGQFLIQGDKNIVNILEKYARLKFDEEERNIDYIIECFKNILGYFPNNIAKEIEEKLIKLDSYKDSAGKFDWIDSQLIRSMQNGDWLLVHGANICSPSVLDRLNPLLEPNGVLTITERGVINGEIVTVKPHKDFRIILELDFRHGELSRAMRNRGLEIWLDSESDHDLHCLANLKEVQVAEILLKFYKEYGRNRLETLIRSSSLCKQLMQNGKDELSALKCSISHVYNVEPEIDILDETTDTWTFGEAHVKDFQHNVSIANSIRYSEYLQHIITNEKRNFVNDFIVPYLTVENFKSNEFAIKYLQYQFSDFKDIIEYCSRFLQHKTGFLLSFVYYLESCIKEKNLIKTSRNARKAFNPYHPSVLFLEKFTELVFREIIEYLEKLESSNSSIVFKCLNQLISWINFCSIDISTYNVEEYISLLTLHLNWINAKVLAKLPTTSGALRSIMDELEEIIPQENSSVNIQRRVIKSLSHKTLGISEGKEVIIEKLKQTLNGRNFNESCRKRICYLFSLISLEQIDELSVKEAIDQLESELKENTDSGSFQRDIKKDILELINCKDSLKILKDVLLTNVNDTAICNSVVNGLKYCENSWNILPTLNFKNGIDMIFPSIFNRLSILFDSSANLHTVQQTKLAFELNNRNVPLKTYRKNTKELAEISRSLFIKSFDNSCTLSNFAYVLFKMLERLRNASRNEHIQLPNQTLYGIWSILQQLSTDYEEDFKAEADQKMFLAQLSVQIGLIYLYAFRPLSTVDPVYRQRIKRHLAELELSNLQTEVNTRKDYQFRLTGLANLVANERTSYLVERIEKLEKRLLLDIEKTFRPNTTDFIKLHTEIKGFAKTVESSFIMKLMTNIEDVEKEEFSNQLGSFKETLRQFTNRLKKFDYYSDVTGPILNGISLISHGLDLACLKLDEDLEALIELSLYWPLDMTLEHLLSEETIRILSRHTSKSPNELQWQLCEIILSDIQAKGVVLKRASEEDNILAEAALEKVLLIWRAIDEEKRRKELEEESLYKIKEHGEKLTEAEKEEREIRKLFPEFPDFENVEVEKSGFGLTDEKIRGILNLYSKISSAPAVYTEENLIWGDSILKRQMLLSDILFKSHLKEDGDRQLIYTLSFANKFQALTSKTTSFYHEGNVQQAIESIEVLKDMRKAVEIRLAEWPEHPTLQKINEIIEKILNLPVNSVLARFAAGLQLLLMECEEWQKVASRRVSLIEEIGNVTKVLISYRKIELESWKEILEFELEKCKLSSFQFAFRILAATREVKSSEDMTTCLNNIKEWLENAKLGDFNERYRILSIIHSSCLTINPELAKGVYNIKLMYSIFVEQISDNLESLQKPIDKELKSYVKICRWNDRTFWALKTGVEKAHKTVHKFIKKFKEVLYGKAVLVLKDDELKMKEFSNDIPEITLTKQDITLEIDNVKNMNDKTFKYSSWIIYQMQDMQKRIDLQEVRLSILETYNQFLTADIPNDKEERKKFIKNLQHRKRKSLSDFVTDFTKMGLSYRKGLKDIDNFQGDLEDTYTIDENIKTYKQELVRNWEECKRNHVRCICRKSQLQQAFKTPSKELTTAEIHRSHGLSRHLARFEQKLWSNLCEFFSLYIEFNQENRELAKLAEEGWFSQQSLSESVVQLNSQISNCLLYLSQFVALYQSLPEDIGDDIEIYKLENYPDLLKSHEHILSTLKINIKSLESSSNRIAEMTTIFTKRDAEDFIKIKVLLTEVKSSLEKLSSDIGLKRDLGNSLSECLWRAIDEMEITPDESIAALEKSEEANELQFSEQTFIENFLLSIQNIRKIIKDDEENSELLSCGFYNFNLQIARAARLNHSCRLMEKLKEFVCQDEENMKSLCNLLPLLNYYSKIAESVLNRLIADFNSISRLSTLISLLASNLASRGFCTPEDLIESEEGEGKLEISGEDCAGMASGKGQKDVSNEIDTEEQVEGRKGEEEDKDEDEVEGEDNAIEMTDDFGGEDRDPHVEEKDEDDESQEEEEEEELDKEMGDVGNEGEKLDEKMWGSDEENEEEEKNEEQGGGDDAKGESQLVAKDDVTDAKESNNNEDEQDNDQNEEIREEEPHDDRDFDENETDKHTEQQQKEAQEIEDLPEDMENKDDLEMEEKDDIGSDAEEKDEENPEDNPLDIDNMLEEENKEETNEQENDDETREEPSTEPMETTEDDQEQDQDKEEHQEIEDQSKTASSSYENAIQSEVQSGSAENETEDKEESGDGSAKSETQGRKGALGKAAPKSTENKEEMGKNQKGKFNEDRTISSSVQEKVKNLQTIDRQEESMEYEENQSKDLYEHIKEGEKHDEITVDSATKDQRQSDLNIEEAENEGDEDFMEDEPFEQKPEEVEKMESTKLHKELKEDERKLKEGEKSNKEDNNLMEIDGEIIKTQTVQDIQSFSGINFEAMADIPKIDMEELRKNLEETIGSWLKCNEERSDNECMQRWRQYEICTSSLSRQLCEQLRLVLEPTKKNRLEGDYRSGKRLNMKKVVAYVASDFRKDKIWLRRTKARDRDYHVMLAVDNSASMVKNRCVQVAFEAIALLSNAFKFLEIGKFGLVSFGERVDSIHDLNEPWSSESGAKVLHKLQFNGSQTRVTEMMKRCTEIIYKQKKTVKDRAISELLIIVSDGRSMYGEGMEKVKRSIREARQSGLFVVFVIIDHPDSKDSIMQMRIPRMEKDKLVMPLQLVSYMENFPFPFYVVLRDVDALPMILSDALKQWFEIVATSDN